MNPRGEIPIALDKKRTLRMSYKAIALAEGQLGRPFPSLSLNNLGIREWAALLWASLSDEDPALTIDDAYAFMDEYGLDLVVVKLLEAVASAFPAPKEDDGEKKALKG